MYFASGWRDRVLNRPDDRSVQHPVVRAELNSIADAIQIGFFYEAVLSCDVAELTGSRKKTPVSEKLLV
jgi:hypothetical protein